MRVLFTGGGTGGHILPNVAVIDELRRRKTHRGKIVEVFYCGMRNSLEERMMRENDVPFFPISAGKLRRYFSWHNFVDAVKIPVGFFQALTVLKKIKPDVVFSKGGYVSFPVALSARTLRIPLWLHESDVSPGIANRILARWADKIWLSFEESTAFFTGKNSTVVGNPIRSSVTEGVPEKALEFTGFSGTRPIVLIVGGSTGSQVLNELTLRALPQLTRQADVIHLTGGKEINTQVPSQAAKHYRHYPFLDKELPHCYAACDLVVSRAGSGALFELLAVHKPMLLIPLPRTSSRGDQIENAEIFVHHGWARTLAQEGLTAEVFGRGIISLLHDKQALNAISEAQKSNQYHAAAQKIAQALVSF